MENLYTTLQDLLKKIPRFVSKDGAIMPNAVVQAAGNMQKDLLSLLLGCPVTKKAFFVQINDVEVFDKREFCFCINNKNFLPDSYTRFKKNIGLIDSQEEFIKTNGEVTLSFFSKDCLLEFDSTDPTKQRKEVFFNTTLSKDKIDHLLDKKVFCNATLFTAAGQKDLTGQLVAGTIKVQEKKAKDFEENSNILVAGNNLLAMHAILPRYEKKVKFMYWDILYNTQSDNVPYADSFKHSSYLVMLKNRFEVAKKLLRDDGVIAIQCDDNEQAYIKVLMDEIFGRENKLSTITIKVKAPAGVGQESFLFDVNETILMYAKDIKKCKVNVIKEKTLINDYTFAQYNKILKIKDAGHKIDTLNSKVNGNIELLQYDDFEVQNITKAQKTQNFYKENRDYIIETTNPQGGLMKKLLPKIPKQGLYSITYSPSKGEKAQGKITYYFLNGRIVVWLGKATVIEDDKLYKLSKMTNLWTDNIFQGISAEGGVQLLNAKKPETLLQRLLELATNKGDIVLDAYFGSGTTGAVCLKMGRKFIGIEQLTCHIELAKKRLCNVLGGDATGISKSVGWKGGGAFLYFGLAKLNLTFAGQIQEATTKEALLKIARDMYDTGFVSYLLNNETLEGFIQKAKTDKDATIQNIKKQLLELLDANQLYVNFCDRQDKEVQSKFNITKDDIDFTQSFYEGVN